MDGQEWQLGFWNEQEKRFVPLAGLSGEEAKEYYSVPGYGEALHLLVYALREMDMLEGQDEGRRTMAGRRMANRLAKELRGLMGVWMRRFGRNRKLPHLFVGAGVR